MKIKKIEKLMLFLIVVRSIFMIFFTPYMEYPDSVVHINRIINHFESTNPTYFLMKILYIFTNRLKLNNSLNYELIPEVTTIVLQNIPSVKYLGYTPVFIICGMFLQTIFVILSIYFFYYVLNRNKKKTEEIKRKYFRLILLYYSTISMASLMLNITQDYFIYIFQPFYIFFLYEKKYIKALLISLVLLKFVDNAALSNIIFLIFYIYFLYLKKIIKNQKIFICLSILTMLITYFIIFPIAITFSKEAMLHKAFNESVGSGKVYTKIGGMILSSFYLGGYNSFITFKIFYIIYVMILIILAIKILLNGKELPECFSIIMTVSALLYLVRNLGHIKYITFVILLIILFVFKYLFKDENIKKEKIILNFVMIFFILSIYETLKMFLIVYF